MGVSGRERGTHLGETGWGGDDTYPSLAQSEELVEVTRALQRDLPPMKGSPGLPNLSTCFMKDHPPLLGKW